MSFISPTSKVLLVKVCYLLPPTILPWKRVVVQIEEAIVLQGCQLHDIVFFFLGNSHISLKFKETLVMFLDHRLNSNIDLWLTHVWS